MAAVKGKTNWFAIGVSVAIVVVLLVLAGVVILLNSQAKSPGASPQGETINSESGAITLGTGENTIGVFLDFMCPACGSFEAAYGKVLQDAALADEITLEIHPIAILDHLSQGTEYSSRASGAMFCVAEKAPDFSFDFMNLLFANQPMEGSAGLPNETLVQYAEQVGAGAAADCITSNTYKKFGKAQAVSQQITGTPTIEINGERIPNAEISARFAEILK